MKKKSEIPRKFWEDEEWAHKKLTKLAEKYPDMWVSIFNKKIVIADKDLAKVETETEKRIGTKMFPVFYVECGKHIY